MQDSNTPETATNQQLKCKDCGAILKFAPDTHALTCEYCGAQNVIDKSDEKIEEIDFESFVADKLDTEEKQTIVTVKCTACGSSTTLKPNITSDLCPFCGTSLVVTSGSTSTILKPKSLLPFLISQQQGFDAFRKWIKKLWFAPNALMKFVNSTDKFNGMYIPYWTYDSNTASSYTGARGTHYYVTETYTTTENGKTVTKTRQVQKTRWTPVSGNVTDTFDDVLIVASNSLPLKYAEKLEPWDLENLTPYDDKFLSGFRTESYQVDVKTGFDKAKVIMDDEIRVHVEKDIGGDEQRIYDVHTTYSDIMFKHVLLPIWISSYRYHDKVFRFLVNGRTGEVQGERPWSVWKIIFFSLSIIAVLVGGYFLIDYFNNK
jgi:Zn finger protein HypA/HybF involved in hydrogenase expression